MCQGNISGSNEDSTCDNFQRSVSTDIRIPRQVKFKLYSFHFIFTALLRLSIGTLLKFMLWLYSNIFKMMIWDPGGQIEYSLLSSYKTEVSVIVDISFSMDLYCFMNSISYTVCSDINDHNWDLKHFNISVSVK